MPRTSLVPVAALAISALTLTACGGGGSGSPAADPAGEARTPAEAGQCTQDKVGGTITMGEYVMLPSFAPGQGQYGVRGGAQSAAVYDRLMRWNPESAEFEPQLAESLESAENNTVWTLTLREGVTFSNGNPLTSQDVLFTVGLHQDPATRSVAQTDAMQIENTRALDPHTVEFTLTEPWAGFPILLAGVVGEVIPEQAYQETDPEEWARSPIGAGAFVLDSYTPGQEVVLTPNPDYYGGPVCPELRFIRVPGSQATYDAFQAGEIELGFLRGAKFVTEAQTDGTQGFEEIVSPGTVLTMNTGTAGYDGILTDVRARQAVAHALDRELIDDRLTGGIGLPTSTLLSESSRLYDGQEGPSYDEALATELVTELKEDDPGWNGALTLLISDGPENVETGVVTKALLNAAGFDVTIENAPVSRVAARQFTGDFEIVVGGMTATEADPASSFASALTPGGSTNLTGIDDPELIAAVSEFKAAEGLDAQQEAYTRLQEIHNRLMPFTVVANVEQYVTVDESVKGVVPTFSSTMLFDSAYVEE